jgi:hypothetical protein
VTGGPRLTDTLTANLAQVRDRMSRACAAAGRAPGSVRLVAVSKTFGIDHVRAAAAAGQTVFGENRVQEAAAKIDQSPDLALEWHLIGHLQSNKLKRAAALFSCIHSVDRVDKLQALDAAAAMLGRRLDVLVQADLAGEATKHGAPRPEISRIFDAASSCPAARVVGLMLLPPFLEDPEGTRPCFRELRALRDELAASGVEPAALQELSMGMSHDFEVAIDEGSTIVRIGSAIFGDRHVRNQ